MKIPGKNFARSRLFEYSNRIRNWRDRRKVFRSADLILRDAQGTRFVLYPWSRQYVLNLVREEHERDDFRALELLVREGATTFDVGANIGKYAVRLSRLCGSAGRVFAFEPVLDTYWMLRETLVLNRCENVTPVSVAICDRLGTTHMNLFEPEFSAWNGLGSPTMHVGGEVWVKPSRSVEVPAETLDHFCEKAGIERIDFLKVDVEGFEKRVFQGAGRLLTEKRIDAICFEISQEPLRAAGYTPREVFETLKDFGYSSFVFDGRKGKFQGAVTDTQEYWHNYYATWRDLVGNTGSPNLIS